MKLLVLTRSALSYGGNTTYTLAGRYLGTGLADHGVAITEIDITVCFRGGQVRNASLQETYDEFHATYLPSLPLVKFFRKKGRISLTYETTVTDAMFLERHDPLSVTVFSKVLREIAHQLHLMDARLKVSDGFDLAGFHRDVIQLAASSPTSDEDLRAIAQRLEQEAKERLGAMDPWERMEIDWDAFHPAARRLLNDPFFWDMEDYDAPHGNDTGADLLSDFRKWNRCHPNEAAHLMTRHLLDAWGIAAVDGQMVDDAGVRALLQSDPIALSVTDEALIAVAFAAVKLRGYCDRPTQELAQKAIERESMAVVVVGQGGKDSAERRAKLGILASALRQIPENPPA